MQATPQLPLTIPEPSQKLDGTLELPHYNFARTGCRGVAERIYERGVMVAAELQATRYTKKRFPNRDSVLAHLGAAVAPDSGQPKDQVGHLVGALETYGLLTFHPEVTLGTEDWFQIHEFGEQIFNSTDKTFIRQMLATNIAICQRDGADGTIRPFEIAAKAALALSREIDAMLGDGTEPGDWSQRGITVFEYSLFVDRHGRAADYTTMAKDILDYRRSGRTELEAAGAVLFAANPNYQRSVTAVLEEAFADRSNAYQILQKYESVLCFRSRADSKAKHLKALAALIEGGGTGQDAIELQNKYRVGRYVRTLKSRTHTWLKHLTEVQLFSSDGDRYDVTDFGQKMLDALPALAPTSEAATIRIRKTVVPLVTDSDKTRDERFAEYLITSGVLDHDRVSAGLDWHAMKGNPRRDVIFEFNTSMALLRFADVDHTNAYSMIRTKVNPHTFEPEGTASGTGADGHGSDARLHVGDDRLIVIEATGTEGEAQCRAEVFSTLRHLAAEANMTDRTCTCVFVAPTISDDFIRHTTLTNADGPDTYMLPLSSDQLLRLCKHKPDLEPLLVKHQQMMTEVFSDVKLMSEPSRRTLVTRIKDIIEQLVDEFSGPAETAAA